jgi:putative iron-dependent peroxidase
MTQAQKGICAEPNLHALFLTFTVVDDDPQAMRVKLVRILDLLSYFDDEYYEAMVSGVLAIGTNYWYELYPDIIPRELAPFPDIHCEDRSAPNSPGDLFILIKADRTDICHAIGVEIFQLLKPHVDLYEEVRGFRYLDGRDLTGFVDGAENPRGMKKFDIAIVGDDDPDFTGGSYLHIQRYQHNMQKWQLLPISKQQHIIGRNKTDNVLLDSAELASDSDTACAQSATPNKNNSAMLTQNMPYGDICTQGLYFVSCASSPQPFIKLLQSRVVGDEEGNYDKLLDYTTAETGGAFFAPSITFIKQQAKG